jgi:large subunit ribosomal protein L4
MATVPVYMFNGEKSGELELNAEVFGLEPNEALIHQAVLSTLANRRQGTADTLTRGEVQHSTRKLYRQKGTGRARQGARCAPHMKGGGVVFGPHPRDYRQSLPKKMRRAALLSALSSKVAEGAVIVVDSFAINSPKTKDAVAFLKAINATKKKVMLVLDNPTPEIVMSFRNLQNVWMTTPDMLGTYDVLHANTLIFSKMSIAMLEELKTSALGSERWMEKQIEGDTNE